MQRLLKLRLLPFLAAGCLVLAGTVGAAWAASVPGWRVFGTVSPHNEEVQLNAVTAISPRQAWAVGPAGASTGEIVEHWNGRSWGQIAVPRRVADRIGPLSSVSAVSLSDVWIFDSFGHWLHLNGSRWTGGSLPALAGATGGLLITSTLATGRPGIWAFGWDNAGSDYVPYAAHFNGSTWRARALPGPVITEPYIADASAASPSGIWAVLGGVVADGQPSALVHWTGHSWHQMRLPASLAHAADIDSVLALRGGTVWVAGFIPHGPNVAVSVSARWNGHSWKVEDLPPVPSAPGDYLEELVSDGAGGMWALGSDECCTKAGPFWHYRAGRWAGPDFVSNTKSGYLHGTEAMALIPGTTSVWATGGEYGAHAPNHEIGVVLIYGKRPA